MKGNNQQYAFTKRTFIWMFQYVLTQLTWFECFVDATWHSVVKKYMRSDIIAWRHQEPMNRFNEPNCPKLTSSRKWIRLCITIGYICIPCSLKEGTEMSRPVSTAAVRVTGSGPQGKPGLRGTCCLFTLALWSEQLDAIITCIDWFSLHSK